MGDALLKNPCSLTYIHFAEIGPAFAHRTATTWSGPFVPARHSTSSRACLQELCVPALAAGYDKKKRPALADPSVFGWSNRLAFLAACHHTDSDNADCNESAEGD